MLKPKPTTAMTPKPKVGEKIPPKKTLSMPVKGAKPAQPASPPANAGKFLEYLTPAEAQLLQKIRDLGFQPPNGEPTEHLAFINDQEAKMLKDNTDGTSTLTQYGIPSYSYEDSHPGESYGSNSSSQGTSNSSGAPSNSQAGQQGNFGDSGTVQQNLQSKNGNTPISSGTSGPKPVAPPKNVLTLKPVTPAALLPRTIVAKPIPVVTPAVAPPPPAFQPGNDLYGAMTAPPKYDPLSSIQAPTTTYSYPQDKPTSYYSAPSTPVGNTASYPSQGTVKTTVSNPSMSAAGADLHPGSSASAGGGQGSVSPGVSNPGKTAPAGTGGTGGPMGNTGDYPSRGVVVPSGDKISDVVTSDKIPLDPGIAHPIQPGSPVGNTGDYPSRGVVVPAGQKLTDVYSSDKIPLDPGIAHPLQSYQPPTVKFGDLPQGDLTKIQDRIAPDVPQTSIYPGMQQPGLNGPLGDNPGAYNPQELKNVIGGLNPGVIGGGFNPGSIDAPTPSDPSTAMITDPSLSSLAGSGPVTVKSIQDRIAPTDVRLQAAQKAIIGTDTGVEDLTQAAYDKAYPAVSKELALPNLSGGGVNPDIATGRPPTGKATISPMGDNIYPGVDKELAYPNLSGGGTTPPDRPGSPLATVKAPAANGMPDISYDSNAGSLPQGNPLGSALSNVSAPGSRPEGSGGSGGQTTQQASQQTVPSVAPSTGVPGGGNDRGPPLPSSDPYEGIMPWDRMAFDSIRKAALAAGLTYTPAQFITTYYNQNKGYVPPTSQAA
jgi:hypothetical protein